MEPLDQEQTRVLGCLLEKAATTPDSYPLSTNALLNACNQSSNREPVVRYEERTVDQTLLALRELGLVRTIRGSGHRVFKHRHVVDEALGLDAGALAVLAVMMLRGPQTLAELRTRTERYGAFDDSSEIEATLAQLAERDPPFVRLLARQPGQKEPRYAQLLSGELGVSTPPAEEDRGSESEPLPRATPAPSVGAAPASEAEVAALRAEVADLRRRFEELCERLGEPIP